MRLCRSFVNDRRCLVTLQNNRPRPLDDVEFLKLRMNPSTSVGEWHLFSSNRDVFRIGY